MDPKTRQQLLIAVIVLCLIAVAYWWYQSPYGPGGRNKYGIIQVSWTNTTTGVGNLVIALSRTPSKDVKGGKVSSITPGLAVSSSTTLSAADAKTVEGLLGKIDGQVISDIDTGANTITFSSITPPAGWPVGKNWTAPTTTGSLDSPSAYLNVLPSSGGS